MEQLLEKWKSEQMNQLLLRSHFIVSFFFPHLSIITPTLCRALVSKRNSIEGRSLSTKPFLLLMTPKQHLHQSPTSPKPPPMDPIPALLWTKNSSTEFSEKWSSCQMLLKFPDFEKKMHLLSRVCVQLTEARFRVTVFKFWNIWMVSAAVWC